MKIKIKRGSEEVEVEADGNSPPSMSEDPVAEVISQMERRALELHLQEEEEMHKKREEYVEHLRKTGRNWRGFWAS